VRAVIVLLYAVGHMVIGLVLITLCILILILFCIFLAFAHDDTSFDMEVVFPKEGDLS
jgi:hypothetical protein